VTLVHLMFLMLVEEMLYTILFCVLQSSHTAIASFSDQSIVTAMHDILLHEANPA
jgi:hypothetical protein